MDVRCGRCSTEYEFDDALVSERGTTVKCTNCGHQFKVFPARSGIAPERWVVRTRAGRELVYTSLRDLQRGISRGQIGPQDVLSRGGQTPRPLGSIAELEPFFRREEHRGARKYGTLAGVGPISGSGTHVQPYLPSPSHRPPPSEDGGEPRSRIPTFPKLPPFGSELDEDGDLPTVPPTSSSHEEPPADEAVTVAPPAVASTTSPPSSPASPSEDEESWGEEDVPLEEENPVAQGSWGEEETPVRGDTPGEEESPAEEEKPLEEDGSWGEEDVPLEEENPLGEGSWDPDGASLEEERTAEAQQDRDLAAPALVEADSRPRRDVEEAPSLRSGEESPTDRGRDLPAPLRARSTLVQRERRTRRARRAKGSSSRGPSDTAGSPDTDVEVPWDVDTSPRRLPPVAPKEAGFTAQDREHASLRAGGRSGSARGEAVLVPSPRAVSARRSPWVVARWISGLILLGALTLLGVSLVERTRTQSGPARAPAPVQDVDGRAEALVQEGLARLAEGDLQGSGRSLSGASELSPSAPRVLIAQAQLRVVRADRTWLELLLLDPQEKETVRRTRQRLGEELEQARLAVAAASRSAPEELGVLRLRIDVLRLARNVPEARELVGPISAQGRLAENAYVLAALDLAEDEPPWKSVIERLHRASAGEGGLGRARAALVFALARSGDPEASAAELAKLGRSHPLEGSLRAFLRRSAARGAGSATVPQVAAVGEDGQPAVREAGPATTIASPAPADYRALLREGNAALRRGDAVKAERLFRRVLEQEPGNAEAEAGLAVAAARRRDPRSEMLLEDALAKNPNYLPALRARAEQLWSHGERLQAAALYERILQLAGPDSTLGKEAATRLFQPASPAPETSVPQRAEDRASPRPEE